MNVLRSRFFETPQTHAGAALFLIVACLILFLPGFFNLPPTDRDESRFAQATKQMVATGDYINIRLQNEARNKKPAGIHWLQAAAVKITGYGEAAPIWVYRIPSLLGAMGAVLFTYWALIGFLSREEAFYAALLLSACVLIGVEARLAKTDAMLLATTTAAMGALLRYFLQKTDRSTFWIFWLSLAAGFLIKGPIVLLVTGGAAVFLSVWKRSAVWMNAMKPLYGVPLFVLLAAPWYIAIIISTEGQFLHGSVGHDMFGKVVSAQETHGAWPGTYFVLMWATFFSASVFLAALAPKLKSAWRTDAVLILLAWIVPTWLVFEIVPTKLPHYVLPVYPAIAGIIALLASREEWELTTRWERVCMSVMVWLPSALLFGGAMLLWQREHVFEWITCLLAIVAALLGWLIFSESRTDARKAIVLCVLSAAVVYSGIFGRVLPDWNEMWLSPRMAASATKHKICPDTQLASAAYHEPSMVFATRTDILLTDGSGAADFLLGGTCRAAFVDEAPGRHGEPAELEAFQQRLRKSGITAKRLDLVEGRNVNGGHLRRMGLWVLEKE